jgi:glycosyltransferase involved in cell wall biosynthesis
MRIAIVNKFLFVNGGQESVMLDEAQWLSAEGHTVALWGMDHPRNLPDLSYRQYFVETVDFSRVDPQPGAPGAAPPNKWVLAKNFIHNAEAARRFKAFLDDFKPEIIHAHGIAHQLTTAILPVATQCGVPVVNTLHDYQIVCPNYTLLIPGQKGQKPTLCSDTKCFGGRFINAVTHRCVKGSLAASALSALEMQLFSHRYPEHVARFISPSQFLKQLVVRAGIAPDQCVVVPNAYTPLPVAGLANTVPLPRAGFLYLGRLSYEKGLHTLLDAFAPLTHTTLTLIGTGPLQGDLELRIAREGLHHIRLAGFVSRDDLAPYYQAAQAVVLPSEWYENAPMVILEAFAHRTPVIGSAMGGIPETVQDGVTGLTFAAGDPVELRHCVERLLAEPSLGTTLGRQAYQFLSNHMAPKHHLTQLLAVYHDVLARRTIPLAGLQPVL